MKVFRIVFSIDMTHFGKCIHDLPTFSDRWAAYAAVFDPDTHRSCTRQQGQTNYVERCNATFRHHSGRLTRKTLSFSKSHLNHHAAIHAFLLAYNQRAALRSWPAISA